MTIALAKGKNQVEAPATLNVHEKTVATARRAITVESLVHGGPKRIPAHETQQRATPLPDPVPPPAQPCRLETEGLQCDLERADDLEPE
jgi:hypothetical protein